MAKNTSVSLGDHFDQFVEQLIASGRYASASEVIRAGLRKLEDEVASGTAAYNYHPTQPEQPNSGLEWLRNNAKAIEAYNEYVAENGTFSDSVRKF